MRFQSRFIFSLPLLQKLADFEDEVKNLRDGLTLATMNLYAEVGKQLLPTPSKSHYLFNLSDMCKVLQGLLQARPGKGGIETKVGMLRLHVHECQHVFGDSGAVQNYQEYSDLPALKAFCVGRLEEYNYEPGMVAMELVLFRDAIEHTCRIARVIGKKLFNLFL
jgi:dynein heavy chain